MRTTTFLIPPYSISILKILVFFCFLFIYDFGKAQIFSEPFNEVGTSGVDNTGGVPWTCTSKCYSGGTFASNGTKLRCHNTKNVVHWYTTTPIDVSAWNQVDISITIEVAGDIESFCNIGLNCKCNPAPTIYINECSPYPTHDYLDIGYGFDGITYIYFPDELNCPYITCSCASGSCDLSGGGSHTFYGDCSTSGVIDDNDINGGTGLYSFLFSKPINVTGQNNLYLRFTMTNSSSDEEWNINDITVTGTMLPVELASFTATKDNNSSLLQWRTLSEINNSHFIVQRSTNGNRFDDIGEVAGAGTTNVPQDYTFIDDAPENSFNYYRLKQMDYDGAFEYSPVRVIDFRTHNTDNTLVVYPTLANESIHIVSSLNTIEDGQIYDMVSRKIVDFVFDPQSQPSIVNIRDLPAGHYIVRIGEKLGRFVKM